MFSLFYLKTQYTGYLHESLKQHLLAENSLLDWDEPVAALWSFN